MKLYDVAYYYERNLQGDITGIVDSQGNEVVKYDYDSWGKLLSITGTLASTFGEANHLRYRGYYYDTESSLYYLQSRYYNPEIGRFISKDDPIYTEGETGVRANAYTYCGNNPVINIDPSGNRYDKGPAGQAAKQKTYNRFIWPAPLHPFDRKDFFPDDDSNFGNRIHPIKKVLTFHNGIDISPKTRKQASDSIVSIADGYVYDVGNQPSKTSGGGFFIKVKSDIITANGRQTIIVRYLHLLELPRLKKGDFVSRNQQIGKMGNTGALTEVHLHLGIELTKE